MKKMILYLTVAAVAHLAMPVTAFSRTPHPSVFGNGGTRATPSRGIQPNFHQHRHRKRLPPFAFVYRDSVYTPNLDAAGGVPYAPGAEYAPSPENFPPRVFTRCVSENEMVPSERGGQVQVTVTRCGVPVLPPSRNLK